MLTSAYNNADTDANNDMYRWVVGCRVVVRWVVGYRVVGVYRAR